MSSSAKLLSKIPSTQFQTYPHLVGMTIFLASLTYPAFVYASKDFNGLTFRLTDPVILVALALSLRRSAPGSRLWPMYALVFLGLIIAAFNSPTARDLFLDLQGPLAVIAGFALFSKIHHWWEAMLIVRYVSFTLWISVVIEIFIYTGVFSSNYAIRSSFAGELAESSGIARLVTPTHILAVVTLGIAIACVLTKLCTLRESLPLIMPSLIVVGLAGTRLSIFFVVLTLVGVTIGSNRIARLNKVIKRLILTGTSLIVALTVASYVWENLQNVTDFLLNLVLRTIALAPGASGTTDASAIYREFEIANGVGQFIEHPLVGMGLGAAYLPRIVNDDSWLGVFGPMYTHNIYVWLAVKVGSVGLTLFTIFVVTNIRQSLRQRDELGTLFRSSFVALLFVGIVWNLIVNVPDSLIFGAVLGILNASHRWKTPLNPTSASASIGGVPSER